MAGPILPRSQPKRPRPETMAMARTLGRPSRPSRVPSGEDAEAQLAIAKILLRRLWRLLEHRYPEKIAPFFEETGCDAHALLEPAFEAAVWLWERDRIYVEPCRRILDAQRWGGFQYLMRWPGGETRVVQELELLELAGMAPAAPIEEPEAEVPY